jgi:hypothetical protein
LQPDGAYLAANLQSARQGDTLLVSMLIGAVVFADFPHCGYFAGHSLYLSNDQFVEYAFVVFSLRNIILFYNYYIIEILTGYIIEYVNLLISFINFYYISQYKLARID